MSCRRRPPLDPPRRRAPSLPCHPKIEETVLPVSRLSAQNLAIEQDVTQLLTNTALGTSPKTIAIVVYALAAAVLAGGVVLHRRAQMDTESLRKKKRLKSLRRQLTSAEHVPPRESADRIAKTLRELVAQYDVARRAEADDAIAQCENIIYSTGQDGGHRLHALMQQALALVDDAAEES